MKSKDNTYSAHLDRQTSERLARYCHLVGITKKINFVAQCVNERLDELEPQFYASLSKEDLITMILNK